MPLKKAIKLEEMTHAQKAHTATTEIPYHIKTSEKACHEKNPSFAEVWGKTLSCLWAPFEAWNPQISST